MVTDVHARYFGAELNDQSLTPGENPRIGPTRFEDWLASPSARLKSARARNPEWPVASRRPDLEVIRMKS